MGGWECIVTDAVARISRDERRARRRRPRSASNQAVRSPNERSDTRERLRVTIPEAGVSFNVFYSGSSEAEVSRSFFRKQIFDVFP